MEQLAKILANKIIEQYKHGDNSIILDSWIFTGENPTIERIAGELLKFLNSKNINIAIWYGLGRLLNKTALKYPNSGKLLDKERAGAVLNSIGIAMELISRIQSPLQAKYIEILNELKSGYCTRKRKKIDNILHDNKLQIINKSGNFIYYPVIVEIITDLYLIKTITYDRETEIKAAIILIDRLVSYKQGDFNTLAGAILNVDRVLCDLVIFYRDIERLNNIDTAFITHIANKYSVKFESIRQLYMHIFITSNKAAKTAINAKIPPIRL
jgi:hypothetical protein